MYCILRVLTLFKAAARSERAAACLARAPVTLLPCCLVFAQYIYLTCRASLSIPEALGKCIGAPLPTYVEDQKKKSYHHLK